MPDLRSQNGHLIKGGWKAWVPDFYAEPAYHTALTKAHQSKYGERAQLVARAKVQDLCEVEFLSRLKDFIKRNADIYAKRWPRTKQADDTLAGFNPEILQTRFIPGSTSVGSKTKPAVLSALQQMAEAA